MLLSESGSVTQHRLGSLSSPTNRALNSGTQVTVMFIRDRLIHVSPQIKSDVTFTKPQARYTNLSFSTFLFRILNATVKFETYFP